MILPETTYSPTSSASVRLSGYACFHDALLLLGRHGSPDALHTTIRKPDCFPTCTISISSVAGMGASFASVYTSISRGEVVNGTIESGSWQTRKYAK